MGTVVFLRVTTWGMAGTCGLHTGKKPESIGFWSEKRQQSPEVRDSDLVRYRYGPSESPCG